MRRCPQPACPGTTSLASQARFASTNPHELKHDAQVEWILLDLEWPPVGVFARGGEDAQCRGIWQAEALRPIPFGSISQDGFNQRVGGVEKKKEERKEKKVPLSDQICIDTQRLPVLTVQRSSMPLSWRCHCACGPASPPLPIASPFACRRASCVTLGQPHA